MTISEEPASLTGQTEERPSELSVDPSAKWGIQVDADFEHESIGEEAVGAYTIPTSKMQRFKDKVSGLVKRKDEDERESDSDSTVAAKAPFSLRDIALQIPRGESEAMLC